MFKRIFWLLLLSFTELAYASAPLTIQQVSLLSLPGKMPGRYFSLEIQLSTQQALSHWALGFYMPRSFDTLAKQINPDLKMEICNAKSICYPLQLLKKPATYATAGYTTILSPVDAELTLAAGQNYLLKLSNNNQGMPANYSAMPQSFFVILQGKEVVPLTDVSPDKYQFANYHANQIKLAVAKHNIDNWLQAKEKIADSLADEYHLVPTPVSIKTTNSTGFTFAKSSNLTLSDAMPEDAVNQGLMANYLNLDLNNRLIVTKTTNAAIHINKIKLNNPEAYQLTISDKAITIGASTPAGVFYALQTLRQLWNQKLVLPGMVIDDTPRFKYRGLMVDVARHFFSVADLKKIIDVMAAQKLNTLHIHFADDEGWRIALAQGNDATLQNLTDVGGARGFIANSNLPAVLLGQANLDKTNRKNFASNEQIIQADYPAANRQYSGFYSINEIKALITYANDHQITLIPEIDLPGHARALIQALPHVFRDSNDKSIFNSVQFYDDNVIPVCLYQQQSTQGRLFTATINDLINRINTLFADQTTVYHQNEVSLGGDEVSKLAWSNDSSCTGAWTDLSALAKSQYFFSKLPATSGLISGWQQLVQDDAGALGKFVLPATATGHLWVWEPTGNVIKPKGIQDAVNLINAGYPTVLAYADDTYLDLTYTPDINEPGFRWAGSFSDTHASLRIAYDALQTALMAAPKQRDNLLGVEGALWSENLYNFTHLAYMALPKMTGLAEAAWASADTTTDNEGKLNWQSLSYRLGTDKQGFLAYLNRTNQIIYRGYPQGLISEIPEQG